MLFTSSDGKQIAVREWTAAEDPVGVVQIAHGMNEYAARYDAFAKRLNALGYIVVADDHRGHGQTDPDTLGYAEGDMFEGTLRDMEGIARLYRSKYAGKKYVLFGFSYGSFLTQAFIERCPELLDGAIIAGSSRQNGAAVRFGLCVAKLACALKGEDAPAKFVNGAVFGGYDKKVGGEHFSWLSKDEENNARYRADPQCAFVCSNNFFRSFFRGLAGLYRRENAGGLDRELPLLLISGEEDPVGGRAGVLRLAAFYRKQGVGRVDVYLVKDSRHEFLNERQHFEEAFGVIAAFIKGLRRRAQDAPAPRG